MHEAEQNINESYECKIADLDRAGASVNVHVRM